MNYPLELTILCRSSLRPQKWKFKTGKSSKAIFPSTPSSIISILQSKDTNKFTQFSPVLEKELKILRKRRMLPENSPGYCHSIHSLALPQVRKKMENRGIWRYKHLIRPSWFSHPHLSAIFRAAKNLQSLVFDPVDRISKLRSIRKARGLQYLHLKVDTNQISAYLRLFKLLRALQKVKLEIKWLSNEKSGTMIMNKFFGFLWNLPKLQHLTVWLDEGGDYYKTLLTVIHAKKLPSFHIVVLNAFEPANLPKSIVNWGNYVDALYIGPIYSEEDNFRINTWPSMKDPEKRLRLKREGNIDDLTRENTTIRNLEIVDFFSFLRCLDKSHGQKLLELISQMKVLENLVIEFGETLTTSNAIYNDFNKEFSQIEALQNLKTFTFSLAHSKQVTKKISPPFGNKTKNLKMLSLNITGVSFDFSDWTEALEDLVSLETFNFNYKDSSKIYLNRWYRNLDVRFPFEQLQNLKTISLNCDIPFFENSQDQLMKSILKAESLESLKIEGEIFNGLDQKKASRFIEDLREKKRLEYASFSWKEIGSTRWVEVRMKRVNEEMVVSEKGERT